MTRMHARQGQGRSKLVRDLPGNKQRDFVVAARQAELTREEESVLRLKTGTAAPADLSLEFRGQDNDLTRRRLAKMEQSIHRRANRLPPKPHPDMA